MAIGGTPEQLQVLREAIEGLDLVVLGDAIAEARALHDRLDAAICAAEAAYTAAGAAEVEGFADTAAFLRHRCRMTLPRSRQLARRAARIAAWPELGDAWRDGRVTGAQVDLATTLVPDRHVERFAETVDDTIDILSPLTARQSGVVLRHWVSTADDMAVREAAEAGVEPIETGPERELSASRSLDHRLLVDGSFDCDSAAIVEKALEAATTDDLPGERRSPKERRADALVAICQSYLDSLGNPDGNRRRERLTITANVVTLYRAWLRGAGAVTAADLERFLASRPGLGEVDRGLFLFAFDGEGGTATTLDGHPVTGSLVSSVAAGGALELLLTVEGRLLHLGRTTRTFTAAQRRAVLARDKGCRGCGAAASRCDIHHVVPWDEGGCTDVDNAVALCRRCHRMLHRRRWPNRIRPDGAYALELEDGTVRTTRPTELDGRLPRIPVATTSEPARPVRPADTADAPDGPGPPQRPTTIAGYSVERLPALCTSRPIRHRRRGHGYDMRVNGTWYEVRRGP